MRKPGLLMPLLLVLPGPALAQDQGDGAARLRELCTERPGLTTAACTVDPGHFQIELGVAEWERNTDGEGRETTLGLAQTQVRYGLAATTELQVGWTAFTWMARKDYGGGVSERSSGIGDVTIGLKQNLRHPQEKANGVAAGLLAYATLPTATNGVGDGDWSAGLIVPLSYKFSDTVAFALSPSIEAATDEDRSGRHLAYGAAAGFQFTIAENLRIAPELELTRDRDPQGSTTMTSAALSLAWRTDDLTQLDFQTTMGLNADTPDVRVGLGISRKF
ncbi:putative MetA-pathway of phenol degradation [Novosphingobium resinovorum]|uniref:Putative MetA-pathway of phenol degradation n=3 Tax=Sphingomonadaceae TaxID=41297 RepID=A0A031K3J4_9SPHN|nr:hypothetical protein BES08_06695 [Novosphingobium resinovorum]EZP83177.1 putative MetA-pathway of phenol degradation [Novosphingobium resinovorum]